MKLIGKKYNPIDNSYCIEKNTGKTAAIVPGCSTSDEVHATFEIISKPYKNIVYFYGVHEHTFIDVKSSKTGKIYRVLYYKHGVIKN